MVEYYKVKEIKGKGLGCIATQDIKRGTLILREAPQISGTQGQLDERSFSIEALLKSYHRLSLEDREAYLQLDTWSEDENICWRDLKAEYVAKNSGCLSEEDLKMHLRIIDIYRVNGCMNGCSIRTSRFNHSCRSNAEATEDGIRAVTNIKSGEEISINYHPQLSMKSAQDRRSQIKKNRGFLCKCLACLVDEDGAKSQEETSKDFAELEERARIMNSGAKSQDTQVATHGIAWRATKMSKNELEAKRDIITIYKKMYQLAKSQNVSRVFIEGKVVSPAYCASVQVYMSAALSGQDNLADQLLLECRNFARVGQALSKVLTEDLRREWDRRANVDAWIQASIMSGH